MTPGASLPECEFRGQRCIEIKLPQGDRALVSLFGAQVLSWQPAGFQEQLYLSPHSVMDGSAPIRGGVPVCFPQFNQRVLDRHALPKHGFARAAVWAPQPLVLTDTSAAAGFELASNAQTLALWPHEFAATVTVRLEPGRMQTRFSVRNTGPGAWRFALALHSYLAVNDITQTSLQGLDGCQYWDAVKHLHETDVRSGQAAGAVRFAGEMDRIYSGVSNPMELVNASATLRITQSASLPDTVVWNPGKTLCANLNDMPTDGWKHMVCVEAARIHDPQVLTSGQSWSGWQQLACIPRA
jgi:glucose-6-phosphate 1-epimerase